RIRPSTRPSACASPPMMRTPSRVTSTPASARASTAGGWMPMARGRSEISVRRSSTTTSPPPWASSTAAGLPTGPPPPSARPCARHIDPGFGEGELRGRVDADGPRGLGDLGSTPEHDHVDATLGEQHRGEHADGPTADELDVMHAKGQSAQSQYAKDQSAPKR